MTYTTVALVGLRNGSLAHGRGVHGEAGLLSELAELLLDTVADGAGIDEDDNVTLSGLDELHDLIEHEALDLGVVARGLDLQGSEQALLGDVDVDEVGGEHEVGRLGLYTMRSAPCSALFA